MKLITTIRMNEIRHQLNSTMSIHLRRTPLGSPLVPFEVDFLSDLTDANFTEVISPFTLVGWGFSKTTNSVIVFDRGNILMSDEPTVVAETLVVEPTPVVNDEADSASNAPNPTARVKPTRKTL